MTAGDVDAASTAVAHPFATDADVARLNRAAEALRAVAVAIA